MPLMETTYITYNARPNEKTMLLIDSDSTKTIKGCMCKPRKKVCPTVPKINRDNKVEVNITNNQHGNSSSKEKDSSACCGQIQKLSCCIIKEDRPPVKLDNEYTYCFVPIMLYALITLFQIILLVLIYKPAKKYLIKHVEEKSENTPSKEKKSDKTLSKEEEIEELKIQLKKSSDELISKNKEIKELKTQLEKTQQAIQAKKFKNGNVIFQLIINFTIGIICILLTYGFLTGYGPEYLHITFLSLFLIAFAMLFKFFRNF